MKGRIHTISVLFFILGFAARPAEGARERWTGMATPNFFVAGNAPDQDIRRAALKLEQFREVLSRLFGKADLRTSAPVRVLVFRNQASYEPVRPSQNGKPSPATGFFQPGRDVHYIALTLDTPNADPWAVTLHEYVHVLLHENSRVVPLWFAEGLAEYYSTFEVLAGEKRVRVGAASERHLEALKARPLLPLEELFAVNRDSSRYNEAEKQGVFYAESWALVHYLLLGKNQRRQPKVAHFIKKIGAGEPAGDSFRGVFETSYREMDAELEKYVRTADLPVQVITFDERLGSDRDFKTVSVSDAQAQFYVGDLLLHMNRTAEAQAILATSLRLDPRLAEARAVLAVLLASQGKSGEAKAEIDKVPSGSANFLLGYYRALVLSGAAAPGGGAANLEQAETVRRELAKVIEINPAFTESYNLLATYNANAGVPAPVCIELVQRALRITPGRQELLLTLARLQLRNGDWTTARDIADGVAGAPTTPELAAEARKVQERAREAAEHQTGVALPRDPPGQVPSIEDRLARQATSGGTVVEPPEPDAAEQVSGMLVEIVCRDEQMSLIVQAGARRLVFRSDAPRDIAFTSYTPEIVARIQCGPRKPAVPVVVRFHRTPGEPERDGDPVAVDFVAPEN